MSRTYRASYAKVFRRALATAPAGSWPESSLQAYIHPNPLVSWLFWKRIDVAVASVKPGPGHRILDLGCGGGVTLKVLADSGGVVTGCDVDTAELVSAICAELGVPARIVHHLADTGVDTFDAILALDVLEHVDDLSDVIGQLRARLNPGGRLVVSGPTESFFYGVGRKIARLVGRFHEQDFSGHYHERDIYAVEAALNANGFRRLELRRLYPPLTLFRISVWTPAGQPASHVEVG